MAEQTPEVVECYRISGEDCFLVRLQMSGIDALEGILEKFLIHGQATTSFVVSTPVPPRPAQLPARPPRP